MSFIAANGVLSAVRKRTARSRSRDDGRRVRVGLEVARDDNWKIFRGKKVGVVSNPTGVLPSTLEHAVDVMHASNGAVDIAIGRPSTPTAVIALFVTDG